MNKLSWLMLLLICSGCGKYSANTIGGAAGNTSSVASISGYVFTDYSATVSSIVMQSILSIHALNQDEERYYQPLSTNCSSGSYKLYYLGETSISLLGETEVDGEFVLPQVPTGKEGLLEFDCDGNTVVDQRCLVKSGDDGVTCNLISDAVVGALEVTLGITDLKQEPKLATKSIAKMASAIVESTNIDSVDSQSFKNVIESCRSSGGNVKSCFKGAIESSSQSSTFEIVKVLAQSWTVEGLFTFLADTLGFQIYVGNFLYSNLVSTIDSGLGVNFAAGTRTLIDNLISSPESYKVKLSCELHYYIAGDYSQNGTKFYAPSQTGAGTAPFCNDKAKIDALFDGANSHADALALIGAEHGGGESKSLESGSGTCNSGEICVYSASMHVLGKTTETNRNDNPYNFDRSHYQSLDSISVFPEGKTTILSMAANANNCLDLDGDEAPILGSQGSSGSCQTWLKNEFGKIKKYFAGVIGLYSYLKLAESQDASTVKKFSLNDIYKMLVGENFFKGKFVGAGVQKYEVSQYRPVLERISNNTYKYQEIFANPNPSAGLAEALLKGKPTFTNTMNEFLQLPTSSQLNTSLANKLTHVPWNVIGQTSEWVARIPVGEPSADFPIFCRIQKMDANNNYYSIETGLIDNSENVRIDCDVDPSDNNSVIDLSEGNYQYQENYPYPYVLMKRGDTTPTNSDPVAGVFSLVNRENLKEVKVGGKPVLMLSSEASICDSYDGKAKMIDYFDYRQNSQLSNLAFCYVDPNFFKYPIPPNYISKKKGFIQVTNSTIQNHYSILGMGLNPVNPEKQFCYFVPRTNINPVSTPGASDIEYNNEGLVTYMFGLSIGSSTEVAPFSITGSTNVPGGHSYADCDDNILSTNPTLMKFFLVPWDDYKSDPNDLNYKLVGSEQGIVLKNIVMTFEKLDALAIFSISRMGEIVTHQGLFVNPKFDIKYDPYCDDFQSVGSCRCRDAVTNDFKSGSQCTFEDNHNDNLTFSSVPIDPSTNEIYAFFTTNAGVALSSISDISPLTSNNIALSEVLTCLYAENGSNYAKKPTFIDLGDLKSATHIGCPSSPGGTVIPNTTKGPLRIPRFVKKGNAYLVAKPQSAIKLYSYATKTVGQGITIKRSDKIFSFDEALALITYRLTVPASNLTVKNPAGTTIPYARVDVDRVDNDSGGDYVDPASAVLRGLAFPSELEAVPILEN